MSIYAVVTGCSGIKSVTFQEAISQGPSQAEVVCAATTLSVGDAVNVDIGTDSDHAEVISNGRVKKITESVPEYEYTITIYDILVNASDAYIAPDDPDAPYEANNIEASLLFGDLLETFADITNYVGDVTTFTFGVPRPTPIKLVSTIDVLTNIAKITGFIYYVLGNTVYFKDRRPYLEIGDVPTYDITSLGSGRNIIRAEHQSSDEKLLNRIVVYGLQSAGVKATASAVSPYLPAGYYKTGVLGHELIQTQAQAQATADLNLTMFNRLTETVQATILGRSASRSRDIVAVTDPFLDLSSEPYFVYGTRHAVGPEGYTTELTCIK